MACASMLLRRSSQRTRGSPLSCSSRVLNSRLMAEYQRSLIRQHEMNVVPQLNYYRGQYDRANQALEKAEYDKSVANINAASQAAQGLVDFWGAVQAELERRAAEEAKEDRTDTTDGTDATPVEEMPVEQPAAETAVEEAPVGEAPAEEAPEQPVEPIELKPKKKTRPTKFQKRIEAIGEAQSIEEAILLDIATGGARFRWGNRASDTKAAKRGIGDLWKYGQNEMRSKIGIVKADGFSIETYAEAIQQGKLIPYGIADGQVLLTCQIANENKPDSNPENKLGFYQTITVTEKES